VQQLDEELDQKSLGTTKRSNRQPFDSSQILLGKQKSVQQSNEIISVKDSLTADSIEKLDKVCDVPTYGFIKIRVNPKLKFRIKETNEQFIIVRNQISIKMNPSNDKSQE
jgi:hypothetical protein